MTEYTENISCTECEKPTPISRTMPGYICNKCFRNNHRLKMLKLQRKVDLEHQLQKRILEISEGFKNAAPINIHGMMK